jgi:hypothetical protein
MAYCCDVEAQKFWEIDSRKLNSNYILILKNITRLHLFLDRENASSNDFNQRHMMRLPLDVFELKIDA